MGNNIQLSKEILKLHETLTHDVYDKGGRLLLRRGTSLESEELIERLANIGYYDPQAVDGAKAASAVHEEIIPLGYVPDKGNAFSALSKLNWVCSRLQAAIADAGVELEKEVFLLAACIHQCCALDSDASTSTLLMGLAYPSNIRHPVNVAVLTTVLLARKKLDEARTHAAIAAALTMNIGAQELHDELFFRSDELTGEQYARIRAHPQASVAALRARKVTNELWLDIVSQHHEAYDGSGYPAGLTGDEILYEAQVVSMADRFCSLVSERAGRDPMLPPQALRDIHTRHGKALGPEMIGALVAAVGIYPPGTCVRLVNGETAVVVHRLLDPKRPVVYAIAAQSGSAFDPPRKRLTASQPAYAIEHAVLRKTVKVPLDPAQLWPAVHVNPQAS
jgi:HD-GYP domain-containing protein (c-di-GMP phosphodiesterase class II)